MMRKATKRRRSSPRKTKSSTETRNGVSAPYRAYAVAADGSRQLLDDRRIVVDLGGTEVEIDLLHGHPILAGQLRVAARGGGLLVVGHGDASSVYVAVEPICGRRLNPS
jgi:hypothetical protein